MKNIIFLLPFFFLLISCAEQGDGQKSSQGEEGAAGTQTEAIAGDVSSPEDGSQAAPAGTVPGGQPASGDQEQEAGQSASTVAVEAGTTSGNTLKPVFQPAQATNTLSPEEKENRRAATQHFRNGTEHLLQNRYAEGVEEFNKYLELDPDNSRAYYNRGLGYYHMQMYNEAGDDFTKAVQLNENDSISALHIGLVQYYKTEYQSALDQYNAVITKYPYFTIAYYNRGIVKGQLSDMQGAINDFNSTLRLDPDYKEAYFNRGLAYFFIKDTIQACSDWQEAKVLGSHNAAEAVNLYCK